MYRSTRLDLDDQVLDVTIPDMYVHTWYLPYLYMYLVFVYLWTLKGLHTCTLCWYCKCAPKSEDKQRLPSYWSQVTFWWYSKFRETPKQVWNVSIRTGLYAKSGPMAYLRSLVVLYCWSPRFVDCLNMPWFYTLHSRALRAIRLAVHFDPSNGNGELHWYFQVVKSINNKLQDIVSCDFQNCSPWSFSMIKAQDKTWEHERTWPSARRRRAIRELVPRTARPPDEGSSSKEIAIKRFRETSSFLFRCHLSLQVSGISETTYCRFGNLIPRCAT